VCCLFYCADVSEQRNSEKDTLQKSVDTLREERSSETDKLKEELKQKLQSAADQYETKLQAEINKGIGLGLYCRHQWLLHQYIAV